MAASYDVTILGAGAAGLMCAGRAGQRGKRVLVLERAEKPGKKILISGGGRCNFTNLGAGPANYLSQNPHFAKSALARYTARDFLELAEAYDIAWHEKTLGQLFCDESAKQIVDMLLAECAKGDVDIRCEEEVRSVLCQRKSRIDMASIMRDRKILLVNLNMPQVGLAKAQFIGKFLVAELRIAGMSRAIGQRTDHYIYCDEFQNFISDAFNIMLSQGRKHGLKLCLAHQYAGQIEKTLEAIMGNQGNCIVFQIGENDAPMFAREFADVPRDEFTSLPPFHAWIKNEHGIFTMTTIAPENPDHSTADLVRQRSRQRYAVKRTEIDYDPPFLPGYSSEAVAVGEGESSTGPIQIDESWDQL